MEKSKAFASLEKIGWGPYTTKVFLQCGVSMASYEIALINGAYITQGCKEEFDCSLTTIGLINSSIHAGILVGTLIFGMIGDRYGRMFAFKPSIAIAAFFTGVLFLSMNPLMMALASFMIGIGEGGENTFNAVVFAEVCPPSKRNYLASLVMFLGFGGALYCGIAFLITITNNTSIPDWRILIACDCFMKVIAVVFRFRMLESPVYLEKIDELEEAEKVLDKISRENIGKGFSVEEIEAFLHEHEHDDHDKHHHVRPSLRVLIEELFSREFIWTCVLLTIAKFFMSFSYNGYLSFITLLLKGLSKTDHYIVIFIQQFGGILGAIICSKLVETFLGRKHTTIMAFFFGGVLLLGFSISSSIFFAVSCASIMYFFVFIGYGSHYILCSESFPTEIRGTAFAFIGFFSRFAGVTSPLIIGSLLEFTDGHDLAISVLAGSYTLVTIFIFFVPETKVKKTRVQ